MFKHVSACLWVLIVLSYGTGTALSFLAGYLLGRRRRPPQRYRVELARD
jgi:hypothetical protein